MALSIVRFKNENADIQWGVLSNGKVAVLSTAFATTAELIQQGYATIAEMASAAKQLIPLEKLSLLSPITSPSQVLCQGANFRQHMIDSGMDPDAKAFNMFFTKSVASITGPQGEIIKPKHVQLLDYEIELTLVLGKATDSEVQVTNENLHEYVAGICIGNDISARDIQIPQMQFHKGKSYRTFCPLGPVLCLLAKDEMKYLSQMNLTLSVNGQTRQQDSSGNLVFKPAETLTEYSAITNFAVGDVLMTGTPAGCALGLPSSTVVRVSGLLPEQIKWKLFKKGQAKRSAYLYVGDVVESHIASSDGKIDLGYQRHTVVSA
jgi:2,4-didehydro-3-deoxy-L-rhamnonate hydrolase